MIACGHCIQTAYRRISTLSTACESSNDERYRPSAQTQENIQDKGEGHHRSVEIIEEIKFFFLIQTKLNCTNADRTTQTPPNLPDII